MVAICRYLQVEEEKVCNGSPHTEKHEDNGDEKKLVVDVIER